MVGDDEVFARLGCESFRSQSGGDYGARGGPGLEDLEPRAASGKQWDHAHSSTSDGRHGIVYGADELDAIVSRDEIRHSFRIAADQTPAGGFADARPDLRAEPAHGFDVGMIFQIAAEHDAIVLLDGG